ncbi:MAG: hypothetical protein WCK27_29815, partial [Verrucomicrobiota bacterium]
MRQAVGLETAGGPTLLRPHAATGTYDLARFCGTSLGANPSGIGHSCPPVFPTTREADRNV